MSDDEFIDYIVHHQGSMSIERIAKKCKRTSREVREAYDKWLEAQPQNIELKNAEPKERKRKAIYCVETNTTYPSMYEASQDIGLAASTIYRACRIGRKANGMTFKYISTEE